VRRQIELPVPLPYPRSATRRAVNHIERPDAARTPELADRVSPEWAMLELAPASTLRNTGPRGFTGWRTRWRRGALGLAVSRFLYP
jgi:hypothetical protein